MTVENAAVAGSALTDAGAMASCDAFLTRWARERPDSVAIADAPNRDALGLGPARSLTFAALDRVIDRIAHEFAVHGLSPGDVVALQVPNIWECAAIALGAWRAGLVVSPLPLLWRLTEIEAGFDQIAPSAIVTVARYAGHDHAATMSEAAFKTFSVRYIFGFGDELPDGVTDIAEWLEPDPAARPEAQAAVSPARTRDTALITWGAASGSGSLAVPRTHGELFALGNTVISRLELSSRDSILSTYPLSTLTAAGGLALPWLMMGAKLVLHQPFDFGVFVEQLAREKVTYTAVPPPLLDALDEGRHYAREALHLKRVACVWPAVAAARGKQLTDPVIPTFDIRNLNEVGLVLRRRLSGRDPTLLPLGKLYARRGEGEETIYLETRLRGSVRSAGTDANLLAGELRLRGPTIPHGPFSAAGKIAQVLLRADHHGYVGTRIQCAVDPKDMVHVRSETTGNFIQHGGVSISAEELDTLYQDFPDFLDAAALAIADPVMGNRVVAAIVPRPDISPSLEEFKRYLHAKQIATYKFPDQLIVVATIPRGSDGKVERDSILSQF